MTPNRASAAGRNPTVQVAAPDQSPPANTGARQRGGHDMTTKADPELATGPLPPKP
jgi:hypothetical protein